MFVGIRRFKVLTIGVALCLVAPSALAENKCKTGFEECSGYLRNSAYKLFEKNYSWGHSWNMKYHNKIVSSANDSSDIYNLIIKEIMKPGMAIGFYNPKSRYKNKKDERGKKVQYTHIALYVGVNEKLEPEFVHLEGFNRMKSNLKRMLLKEYKPVIILDELSEENEIKERILHLDEMVCLNGINY